MQEAEQPEEDTASGQCQSTGAAQPCAQPCARVRAQEPDSPAHPRAGTALEQLPAWPGHIK